jgi:predicted DNA-binding transcriptional regulator YafY
LLPAKVTSAEKPRRPLTLLYRLSKEFARQGATRRFRNHTEEREADGALVVTAEIDETELFWASKTLIKYGASCVALEPPELVAEMKRVVEQMALNYREAYS